MENSQVGITGFTIKVLAIVGMTANHVANVFSNILPLDVVFALYALGGMTFPTMGFLLVEGYLHTSSLRNYALRLLAFAAIAQIPYSLCFGLGDMNLGAFHIPTLNVLFTLLISLGLIWAFDHYEGVAARLLVLIGALSASVFCDWPLEGPLLVLLFFILRDRGRTGVLLAMLLPYIYVALPNVSGALAGVIPAIADMLYVFVGFTLATIGLCLYNGKRGFPMKWFFYAYYPAHLFIIWAVSLVVG